MFKNTRRLTIFTAEDAEIVAGYMASSQNHRDVQIAQTLFRLRVIEGWQIPKGARVLEIGCGQGDMTAALAYAVGSTGRVTAVDSAHEDYGAPLSVGDSAQHLKSTAVGERIDFRFNFNVLDLGVTFLENSFDYVVLAHCSWYFNSLEQLTNVFIRVKPWGFRLCLSDWDLVPTSLDQVPHMLAVLIQGQVEAYKRDSDSNVRTISTIDDMKPITESTGWNLTYESDVDSSQLKDADWEINNCLQNSVKDARALELPAKHMELLGTQIEMLRRLAGRGANRSLSSYSIMAERARID